MLLIFQLLFLSLFQMAASDSSFDLPVPLISVSLNYDARNFTFRMIQSIDYPVLNLIVQIGNADEKLVRIIANDVKTASTNNPNVKNLEVRKMHYNPGSAKGFNFGLKYMMHSLPNCTWALIVNNDISFYAGVLKRISNQVESHIQTDPKFGIGFTSLCCGGEWSAVVFTKRMVTEVGFFDENFYPAYYEDDDYAIRIHYSNYKAYKLEDTPLQHGDIDGSKDYISGVFKTLYYDKIKSDDVRLWKQSHEAGVAKSAEYLEKKWGVKVGNFKDANKFDCKTIEGINEKCKTGFTVPFNRPAIGGGSIAHWHMMPETIERINADREKAFSASQTASG